MENFKKALVYIVPVAIFGLGAIMSIYADKSGEKLHKYKRAYKKHKKSKAPEISTIDEQKKEIEAIEEKENKQEPPQ